jgi:hypothetical protein
MPYAEENLRFIMIDQYHKIAHSKEFSTSSFNQANYHQKKKKDAIKILI